MFILKLKTNQTTSITTDNNEEGIRCVWYYKGAFHGVTTFYSKKKLISNSSTIIDFSVTPESIIRKGAGKY